MSQPIAKQARAGSGPWSLLLLILLLVDVAAADRAPVYRIERADELAGYLVGTMHSEDPRVTALMTQLTPLIAQVDLVAVEMVPDVVTMLAVGAASVLPAGQDLRALLGMERFGRMAAVAKDRGIPLAALERLKPWAAAVMLGMPDYDTGRFLDMDIYLQALDDGREVIGLETAAEQLAVFEQMPAALQLQLLDEMVKNADQLPTQLEELTGAYLSGDLQRLDTLARSQYHDMSPQIRTWFDESLLRRRNLRMIERASALLSERAALLAVGAMHLGGEDGLIEGLRRRGFHVTAGAD